MPDEGTVFVDLIIKAATALFTWILVVLGWAVVHDMTTQRERKKSEDSKIDQLRKLLGEIEDMSIKHHSEKFDGMRAKSIARKIKMIGIECSHLERSGVISSDWRSMKNGVSRTVTLKNFEINGHEEKDCGDRFFYEMESAFDKFHVFLIKSVEHKSVDVEPLRKTLFRILKRI